MLPALPNITLPPAPNVGRIQRVLKPVPFVLLHVAAVVAPFFVPLTWTSAALCVGLYVARMFGITGVYHRYFAHRTYKTSRWFQFALAWLGCSAMQKGPLWWAGHHRHHHKHSDQDEDPHSPIKKSVWWAHVGWVISSTSRNAPKETMQDFSRFPELRALDSYLTWVPGLLLAATCYLIDGMSGLVWGFLVSTILLYHGTFLVNSACHLFGTRRYQTTDHSRNCWWAAILTLGEGWHNNHHHYQSCARQGFKWWEVDVSYYVIRTLGAVGLVWDIREPTPKALKKNLIQKPATANTV
ncbi:acyl-CoA desaturase [Gemmata sp.]|uniref:acyl-CoA desaturase n=1 Tax=Gemmata sp. TaxID=1914242 RepID=UPI003F728195